MRKDHCKASKQEVNLVWVMCRVCHGAGSATCRAPKACLAAQSIRRGPAPCQVPSQVLMPYVWQLSAAVALVIWRAHGIWRSACLPTACGRL